MFSQQQIFFEFLRYNIGTTSEIPSTIREADWRVMYNLAKKQTLIGVLFGGIQLLPKELAPDADLLMTWMGKAQQIRRQNMRVNMAAGKLHRKLREDGLRCCILKGQGNALMYPNPYSRNPGDIDVWVNDTRARITEYARGHFALEDGMRYHHLETTMDGVPVELHFVPGTMNNPVYNRRLQEWFKRNGDLQCSNVVRLPDGAGEIAVPTCSFNVIYQLSHLYHHFFDEGIGMRQMIDYYYVLKSLPQNSQNTQMGTCSVLRGSYTNFANNTNKACAMERELKHLGLWKFAGAVMWVLHETLGLPESLMIAPMDEKRGWLLLTEILDGGNFGKHAEKYGHFTQQGMANKYFLKIWRNMHFVRYYPAEALSEPIFRTWHFFWRVSHRVR